MSDTNYNWTSAHPRFVASLTGVGGRDIVGMGADGVWSSLNQAGGGFDEAAFGLVGFEANAGWRSGDHPRFTVDLTGDGRADIVGFGDDGVWTALGNGDGGFQPAKFVLSGFNMNQGWRVDQHPRFLADLTGDGRADIVGFGDDGVWTALGNGDGGFQPAKFVLADFGRRSNQDTIVRREIVTDHRLRGRIKHIFVLMLENRSYDHMLGFAGLSGVDAANGAPTTADGLTGNEFNTFQGVKYSVVPPGAPDVTVAPGHNFPDALEQLCGQYAQYPNGGPYPEVNNTGFVSSLFHNGYSDRPGDIMQCFKREHVPILRTLAEEFAVCDRWFCSMPGPTEPNRYFLHAASSSDYDDSPPGWKLGEGSVNHFGGIDFEGGNIFDALDRADIETRIYSGDNFPVVGELEGVSNTFDVHDFDNLADDLQDSDFGYGFIHIEPRYFDGLVDTSNTNFGNGNSQHPTGGVAAGERLIKATYEAIRNSPHWESSMLIVTYDEHGGFYDHVAPGPAGPTGSTGSMHGFKFDQLGARVPAVVVSPLIPRGLIEHRLLEHCSVIKTVCDLFDVPYLQPARDLKGVCGLLHLAQLPAPRADTPERLPEAVVSDVRKGGPPPEGGQELRAPGFHGLNPGGALREPSGDPPDSMIAMTVRVAAAREMAREPGHKQEIVDRMSRIRTPEEAVAYVKEVEAKLKQPEPA